LPAAVTVGEQLDRLSLSIESEQVLLRGCRQQIVGVWGGFQTMHRLALECLPHKTGIVER
jgi:hypothetical protein